MATVNTESGLLSEVRTAFADAGPQRDNDAYTHDMRCLSFLTSDWLHEEGAIQAANIIEDYNRFGAEDVEALIAAIIDTDPDARFAVGREGSPVFYVETDDAQAVVDAIEAVGGYTGPDELGEVSAGAVGSARKDLYGDGDDQMSPHNMCSHERPPVPVEEYAPTSEDKQYVRAWWD